MRFLHSDCLRFCDSCVVSYHLFLWEIHFLPDAKVVYIQTWFKSWCFVVWITSAPCRKSSNLPLVFISCLFSSARVDAAPILHTLKCLNMLMGSIAHWEGICDPWEPRNRYSSGARERSCVKLGCLSRLLRDYRISNVARRLRELSFFFVAQGLRNCKYAELQGKIHQTYSTRAWAWKYIAYMQPQSQRKSQGHSTKLCCMRSCPDSRVDKLRVRID